MDEILSLKENEQLFNRDYVVENYEEMTTEKHGNYVIIDLFPDGFTDSVGYGVIKVKTGSKVIMKILAELSLPARVHLCKKISKAGYEYYDMERLDD